MTSIPDVLRRGVRRLQGERRGMGSELRPPTPREEAIFEPETLFAPTILIQTLIRLADVSFWQDAINFVVMRAAGIFGVIIRAGQRNWSDLKFLINWALAKLAGLPRGSYFFYDSRETPRKQAELWWSLIKTDTGELVHVADFEESYGGPYGTKAHFKEFLLEFQRLSGLPNDRIAIYTGFFWWVARVGNDLFFKRYQLWLAGYSAMSQVRIPEPWDAGDLLFWQYTASGNGTAYGVSSKEIDLNWYCCDLAAYHKRFPLATMEPPPLPPPTGEPMTKYYRLDTTAANIRMGPGTSYADRGDLVRGDVVQVDDPNVAGWSPYKIAQHSDGTPVRLANGTPLDGAQPDTYWSTNAYFVETPGLPNPPVPPPPEPTEEIVITQTFTSPGYVSQTVTTTLKPE